MGTIKVVLWDIDGTLLNFEESEKLAIRACFEKFSLGECTDEMLADYSAINAGYWKRLERGELSKPQVLEGRFMDFFAKYSLDTGCVSAFNAAYQLALGEFFVPNPGGLETVRALRGRVRQYAVTNGTLTAQRRKLSASGLDELLDGRFISDEIGIEKPNPGFFDAVWAAIGAYEKDEVLIVGDSLTSDMQGGNNAGILCCWFNPAGAARPEQLRIDYEITALSQVAALCGVTL